MTPVFFCPSVLLWISCSLFCYTQVMKYDYLLFDADNTLLDFDENERVSIYNTFDHFGIPCDENTLKMYHEINIMYWRMLDEGKITRDVLLVKRFETLYEKLGIKGDPAATEDFYRVQLGLGNQLVPGAIELCMQLKLAGYKLYIVTNGVAKTQHDRLNGSGLAPIMDGIFISDEIGYNKPAKQFFEYVANHIEGFDPNKALVIGDSLTSDIKGGVDFGLDTCWINFYGKRNDSDIKSTYEIPSILDVPTIL